MVCYSFYLHLPSPSYPNDRLVGTLESLPPPPAATRDFKEMNGQRLCYFRPTVGAKVRQRSKPPNGQICSPMCMCMCKMQEIHHGARQTCGQKRRAAKNHFQSEKVGHGSQAPPPRDTLTFPKGESVGET